ncbi:hypothetical protein M419DRAFT_7741 [Trichoderma reesei RUT C-30]|uniref:Uncharacterized protein n=1 Tax=Hypocrea jecorina (strain ATCC 56765 / BCRC 32924 / NRRL 11460 / Rut C-30) TaxID=1344414 RepID=A0A024SD38_HYPJR|nr:hypothetical protein M419DRAFT_7741 [Trichoderma reesei RUT C-30]
MKMKRRESANETAEIGDMSKLGPRRSSLSVCLGEPSTLRELTVTTTVPALVHE